MALCLKHSSYRPHAFHIINLINLHEQLSKPSGSVETLSISMDPLFLLNSQQDMLRQAGKMRK